MERHKLVDRWGKLSHLMGNIYMTYWCSVSVLLFVRHWNSSLQFSFQCYLFAYFSVWRNSKSFLAFALICLSNMYLYELRNMWQILFHVAVGAFMTLQIRLRQPLGKAPDYNVWQIHETHATHGPWVWCPAYVFLGILARFHGAIWTRKTGLPACSGKKKKSHPRINGQISVWTWTHLCCSLNHLWTLLDWFWKLSTPHSCATMIYSFSATII